MGELAKTRGDGPTNHATPVRRSARPGRRTWAYLDPTRQTALVVWGRPRRSGRWDEWAPAMSAGAYQVNCYRRAASEADRAGDLARSLTRRVDGDVAYAFYSHPAKQIKVGRTTDLRRRWAKLENESGQLRQLLCVWACPDSRALERELHARWADHRVFGEWFQADPLLADIRSVLATRRAAVS